MEIGTPEGWMRVDSTVKAEAESRRISDAETQTRPPVPFC